MLWDNFDSFVFTKKLSVVWVGDTIIYNDQVLVEQRFGITSANKKKCTPFYESESLNHHLGNMSYCSNHLKQISE